MPVAEVAVVGYEAVSVTVTLTRMTDSKVFACRSAVAVQERRRTHDVGCSGAWEALTATWAAG